MHCMYNCDLIIYGSSCFSLYHIPNLHDSYPLKYACSGSRVLLGEVEELHRVRKHGSLWKILNAPYSYTNSKKTWRRLCFNPTNHSIQSLWVPLLSPYFFRRPSSVWRFKNGKTSWTRLADTRAEYSSVMRLTWTGFLRTSPTLLRISKGKE